MRVRRAFFALIGPLAISACALVADLGERTLGDPNAIGTGDAGKDDASKTKKDASKADADDGDPAPTPTYCEGILVYASFDGKLKGDKGGDTVFSSGAVSTSTQGKFGGALSLVGANSELTSPGAAHWLLKSAAGNPWPETKGSMAVWFRSTPGANAPVVPVLYRPVASQPTAPTLTAGLAFYLHRDNVDQMGLYERGGGDAFADRVLSFGIDEVAPFLRSDGYNHYFTAWDQSGSPSAFMALNGGSGETFNGTETGIFPDGGAPFRASIARAWVSEGEAIGVRLGGVGQNSPQGLYDDLVIWNRVVSFAEVAALYASGKAVGDTCSLR